MTDDTLTSAEEIKRFEEQIKRLKEEIEGFEVQKKKTGIYFPSAVRRRQREIETWERLIDMERTGKAPRKIRPKGESHVS